VNDIVLLSLVGLLMAALGIGAGVDAAHSATKKDCDLLGKVVLDDASYRCDRIEAVP